MDEQDNLNHEFETLKENIPKAQSELTEIQIIINDFKTSRKNISDAIAKSQNFKENYETLLSEKSELQNQTELLRQKNSQISNDLASIQIMKEKITSYEIDASSSLSKVKDFEKDSQEKYTEIKNLNNSILGYKGPSGVVSGLKGELENSYDDLKKNFQDLNNSFEVFKKINEDKIAEQIKKIKSLLPDALTAGLASAFECARKSENEERKKSSRWFVVIIILMGITALIPFYVYAEWFYENVPLNEILQKVPSVTCSVLPIYLPLIWLALHLNRKINLEKKLSEEYHYKETIAKTFEGLSNQIENLDISPEKEKNLKVKLLDLLLNTTGENPGKFIKNYDKTDNPLAELLKNDNVSEMDIKSNGSQYKVIFNKNNE